MNNNGILFVISKTWRPSRCPSVGGTSRQWHIWLALEEVREGEIKGILHIERRQSENVHSRGFQQYGLLDNEKAYILMCFCNRVPGAEYLAKKQD